MGQFFSQFRCTQRPTNDNVSPDAVRIMLDAPSLVTQLERFEPLRGSSLRGELTTFTSNPANGLLDVSNRLVVGKHCGGGAQADVFDGKLLTSEVDSPVIQRMLQDEGQFRKYIRKRPMTFTKVAIKQPRYYKFLEDGDKAAKSFLRELQMWRGLEHPNVLPLRGIAFANSVPVLVSDWMDGGSLTKYRATYPQLDITSMATQIATGLQYLHEQGIVHADLKADNILVNSDGHPMLADFGISRFISVNGEPAKASYEGSLRWMARELIRPPTTKSGVPTHTRETDVWALGMVLFEMLSGEVPFSDKDDLQVIMSITSGFIPSRSELGMQGIYDDLWYLCQRCWTPVSRRLGVSQLLTALQIPVLPSPLDPKGVPAEFKTEEDSWFVVYNPRVPKTMVVELMHTFEHTNWVFCVCFSLDGKYIATGCDQTAHIFDAVAGEEVCALTVHKTSAQKDARIWSVCLSPDGKYLAAGGTGRLVQIWDVSKKCIRRSFKGHRRAIYSLSFSRNGRFVVSGSHDETVRIWDMESDRVLILSATTRYGLYASVLSVAISPGMKLVAGGCQDNVVRIWNGLTGDLVEVLKGHTDAVRSVAFTPNGRGLVSGGYDKMVKHWDLSGLLRHHDRDKPLPVSSSPDPHLVSSTPSHNLLSGSLDSSTIVPVDTTSKYGQHSEHDNTCTLDFVGHKNYVNSVAVSPDGKCVVSGGGDQDVRIWNSSTAEGLILLRGHTNWVRSVDMSPTGDVLATGSSDGTVRLWRLNRA